jgi:hypothetical protein
MAERAVGELKKSSGLTERVGRRPPKSSSTSFGDGIVLLDFRTVRHIQADGHSLRNLQKNVSRVWGRLRVVQALARHSSLQTTQRGIEMDSKAQRKLVELM